MKRTFAILLSLALAAGLVACGDKSSGGGAGGGGVVGSWTMDMDKVMDMAMAEAKKKIGEMPEDQRKVAEEAMGGKAMREMMAKQFGSMKMDVTVSADKTFTVSAQEPGSDKADAMAGTWEEKDGVFTFTTKTKNGQPATGGDAKSVRAKMAGGNLVLSMPDGGPELAFKRK